MCHQFVEVYGNMGVESVVKHASTRAGVDSASQARGTFAGAGTAAHLAQAPPLVAAQASATAESGKDGRAALVTPLVALMGFANALASKRAGQDGFGFGVWMWAYERRGETFSGRGTKFKRTARHLLP